MLLVDDHQVMRHGLAVLLGGEADIQVVGEATDGESGIAMAAELRPDVVLMDISMPGLSGIEATRLIRRAYPRIAVIVLSMHEAADVAERARQAGAVDYITKNTATEVLLAAIRSAGATASR